MLGYVFVCGYVCVWLCVCAASAVGSPVANINIIGIVHIVLMSIYNLTNTCINLKSKRLVWLHYESCVALLYTTNFFKHSLSIVGMGRLSYVCTICTLY